MGWLFLAHASTVSLGGLLDVYANDSLRAEPRTNPLSTSAAVGGDTIFVWWFLLLALILQLTPTDRPINYARLSGSSVDQG